MALFQKTTKKEIKREIDESREDEVSQEELQAGTAYLNETSSDVYQREEQDEFNLSKDVRMQLNLDETVRDKLLDEYPSIFTKAMLGTDPTAKAKLEKILTTVKFFANEPIKHDAERARYKLKLLLGARIIPDILAKYPKTTDINGNGRIIFVDTGESGIGKIQYARYDNIGEFEFTNSQMALPVITDKDIVSFLEFFARRENQMFNAENPLFNGFVDNIRISATFNTISSTGTTFSLRISRPILALNDSNFAPFAPQKVSDLLTNIARSRQTILINGETGTGKALPNDTLIPTPNGYRMMGELHVGDKVFDRLGRPTTILGVYPQGKKKAYRVNLSDGRSVICNDEHLWSYWSDKARPNAKLRTATLRELMDKGITKEVVVHGHKTLAKKFRIPVSKPVNYPAKDFEVDPYVVGAFLGDGSLTNPVLTLVSEDTEIPERVNDLIGAYGVKSNEHNFDYNFKLQTKTGHRLYVYTQDLFRAIPEIINTSDNKFIPNQYKFGSVSQRWSLIQGLFDTDGCIRTTDKKHNISYSSNSIRLINDVQEVLWSLGVQSSIGSETRHDERHAHYVLSVNVPNSLKPNFFKLARKLDIAKSVINNKQRRQYDRVAISSVDELNYDTEMTCIYVDNDEHLFLANDFVVTHNTELLKYFAGFIRPADRIIMVEDVAETQLYNLFPAKDVVAWHTKTYEDYETGKTHGVSLVNLLKQSLRSYPRFVAVSELRGAETLPAYSSMTAGNPFFGTLHSQSNASVISRLIDIIRMEFGSANDESMRRQLLINLGFSFHIVRKELSNGRALRYVDEIVYFDETIDDEKRRGMHVLFKQKYLERDNDLLREYTSYPLPDKLKEDMNGALNYFGDELDKMWGATEEKKTIFEKK